MDSIRPEGYIPRIVDEQVDRYLRVFGAIEIAGTKWCGKTWTSRRHGSSVSYVDESFSLAESDPEAMLAGEAPHVIDEWQLVPAIWDAVRHGVDSKRGTKGRWILTGSSTPAKPGGKDSPRHSGAGRIGRIRMHPMSLAESGDSTGQVSLAGLFNGEFERADKKTDSRTLVNVACRGGWPEAVGLDVASAQLIAREYLRIFFAESVPRQGKDPEMARLLVGSIARNLGQATKQATMLSDMFGQNDSGKMPMTAETLASYLGMLKSLYLVEEIPGWAPPARSRKRFATKPKRYLADPSLAAAMLGMSPDALFADWQTFGLLFENMCIRDLLVYSRSLSDVGFEPVRYYRDDSRLEVDAIVELADGRWAAFEFKTGEAKVNEGASNLRRLRKKLCENPAARTRDPEFMAVITGVSEYAHVHDDGIYVIPLALLGP